MPKVRRLGVSDKDKVKRPSSVALGIGGAGRNIITDVQLQNILNVKTFEVGKPSRPFKSPSISINKMDMKNAFKSSINVKNRPLTRSENKIKHKIKDVDILYILSGLGGDIGSYSVPVCAELGKASSMFVVGLLAKPFDSESDTRRKLADRSQVEASKYMDLPIVLSNEKLLEINPQLPIAEAFAVMNNIIAFPMIDFNGIITKNDLSKLQNICEDINEFRIGAGYGNGREYGLRAIKEALRSPWVEELDDVSKILLMITKKREGRTGSVDDVIDEIKTTYPETDIIWGLKTDKKLKKEIRVTILAGK